MELARAVAVAAHWIGLDCTNNFFMELCQNEWNKCKNHFYEMKGDVGMSSQGNKKMPTPRQKVIHNPIPTSLFLSIPCPFYVGIVYIVLFCIVFSN